MELEKHYSACALNCPDLCAFVVHVENGIITRLEGDTNHPYTNGRCCPKGYAHVLRMYSKDRLLYPLKKQLDGSFHRVSWNAALDEIAAKMKDAKESHGPQSVGVYSGSGNDGMAPRYAARFCNVFGNRLIPGIVEICFEGAYAGTRFNVGKFPPHELSDWSNSKCIVIWGTNKHESSTHCKHYIQEALDGGAKLIVIDPRRIPYAEQADIYTTIRPGTDGALALGIANEIITRGLHDAEFVKEYIFGFEEFKERVAEYNRQRVSDITWVSEENIVRIAKMFANHGPGLITTAPAGMNHYTNGSWAARAVHSLLAICGYLGVSGGGFQYLSSDNSPFNGKAVNLHDLLDDTITPVVPSGTYIPEYVLSHSASPLKVLIVQAASPVTQWPNTNRTIEAFEKIPFTVCIDLELTDTAKLCDIVLPATFIFEHDNLVHSELHRIVQFAPKIVEPRGEVKSELEIWRGIAERLGLGEHFELSETDAIKLALDSDECSNITLDKLRKHPEGIRTNSPAIPFENKRFNTSSGKVELYSSELEELGQDPLPFHEEPEESLVSKHIIAKDFPLTMITGRLRTRLHSQYTTVNVGASVKSYAYCTSCKKCIEECPDDAIKLIKPSPHIIQKDVGQSDETSAPLRRELGNLVSGLAISLPDIELDIPTEMTSLLIPSWNINECIGCRECELDVCPYEVITETIQMPTKEEAESRVFARMHPTTADTLDLQDGELVTIESLRGKISGVRLELTDQIDPRVVWSSDGWWQDDGNVNLLTDDKHTAFGHTPGFNSVLVRVYKDEI